MSNIKIYKEEEQLADKIKNTSIAYCSEIYKDDDTKLSTIAAENLEWITSASIKDEDLYFHKSILVTTNWNKNDDVFLPTEVWAARHTPEDKPNNINHDDSIIVGHIVDNIAIDFDGKIIADNIKVEDLPDKFHILTSEVIYRIFENEECQTRANELIESIEKGEKFVSMECRFNDFDYAVQQADGSWSIVERNDSTSFLTKHLRAYGGSGVYDDNRVGRVIKNLYFSGKGYVDRPANPDSVIFTKVNPALFLPASNNKSEVLNKSGVLCSSAEDKSESSDDSLVKQEVNNMADTNILEKQNDDLKKEVTSLQAKIGELTEKLARADISKYETEISDLKAKLQDREDEIAQAKTEKEDLAGKLKQSEDTCGTLAKEKEELQSSLAKMEDEKIRAMRISSLVDGGVDKEVATKKVELFSNLNDEQFNSVAEEIIASHIKKQEVDDTEVDEAEATAEEVDLDSVIAPQEPDLAAADVAEEDEQDLRNDLVALASEFSPSKKENK